MDTYGGLVPHGGGALSGKDASKVDRSGTYMARYVAKNIVAAGLAERYTVSLAYAIGRAEPVAVDIDLHETGRRPEAVLEQAVRQVFDLTPGGIIRALGLNKPIFARYCNYGHFTRQDAPWERTDRAAALAELARRNGKRRKKRGKQVKRNSRRTAKRVSRTDPEPGRMKRPGKSRGQYYLSRQISDTDYGIITGVIVTLGDLYDLVPYLQQFEYIHQNVIPIQGTATYTAP